MANKACVTRCGPLMPLAIRGRTRDSSKCAVSCRLQKEYKALLKEVQRAWGN
jgi:hypothetical protein